MSKIEVNEIDKQNGSTLTLGGCGTAVTLASGATQSGFGRTGTVNWQTTPKTANFTAVNGEGYFINTTSSAVTMTLPAGSAGAIISIQDYNKTFDTNNLTISPNGSEIINGGVAGDNLIVSTEGQGFTLVYVDSTVGWKTIHDNNFNDGGSNFIIATGGTVTTCGDYKIHTFTGPGTFCVSAAGAGTSSAPSIVDYIVVAGGGSGAANTGNASGGGGAGGYREAKAATSPTHTASPHTASPLAATTGITVTATAFPITVGGGGASSPYPGSPGCAAGNNGSNSVFSTITSAGGGGGGTGAGAGTVGSDGGSGGGGGGGNPGGRAGGSGNTPPVSPAQGTDGGRGGTSSPDQRAGGGGGASEAGVDSVPGNGRGGAGTPSSITGSAVSYAGGGGAAESGANPGVGAASPCGTGGAGGNPSGNAGTTNRGGGGGGAGNSGPGTTGAGGSGIVIIRYKYQ